MRPHEPLRKRVWPIDLRVLVLDVRRCRSRRPPRRERSAAPAHALRRLEGACGGGPLGLADDGFCVVAMRNATVYGASPRLRLDIVLNNLVGWATTSGSIRLLSDGQSWRPLMHVRDLARVTNLFLEAPAAVVGNQAFNVGSNEQNYVVRELASVVSEISGCDVHFAEARPPILVPIEWTSPNSRARFPNSPSTGMRVEAPASSLTPIGRSA